MYVADDYSAQNYTIMLQSHFYDDAKQFIMQYGDVKMKFEIEFTFNCETVQRQRNSAAIFCLLYMAVGFLIAWSQLRTNLSLDEPGSDADIMNKFMINMFLGLIILQTVLQLVDFLLYKNCPWTLDTEKSSNFMESIKLFLQTVIQSYVVLMTLLVVIGFSVLYNRLTEISFKVTFALTIGKFFMIQFNAALANFTYLTFFLMAVTLVFQLSITTMVVTYSYLNMTTISSTI